MSFFYFYSIENLGKYIFHTILYLTLGFFTVLMFRITAKYFDFGKIVAFLHLKVPVWDNLFWRTAFYIHVYTSMFVLIAGFTQFSNRFLKKFPKWHKRIGYLYVYVLLLLSGPTGLIMAFYAFGGIVSKIAFTILSVLWIGFTFASVRFAIKKKFIQHKNFMIRSYALTLSAITLRSWKVVLAYYLELPPKDLYLIVAWLGFMPNLIVAEIIISRQKNKRKAKKVG